MGVGLMISGASAGAAAGLVVGGVIVDHLSWHGIFYASAAFGVIAFLAVFLGVSPSARSAGSQSLNWASGLLFIPGIFALLLLISNMRSWGFFDWRSMICLVVGLILMLLWVRSSLREPNPLVDVRLFRNRHILIANIAMALIAAGTFQATFVFSLLLQAPKWTMIGLGTTATMAGLIKLPANVGALFAGPLCGWLTQRSGGRRAMAIGGLIATAGWVLAIFKHDSLLMLGIIISLLTFGTTILFAVGPTILVDAAPSDRTSEAIGMLTVVRQAFVGIGAQITAVLLAVETVSAPGGGASYPSANAFILTMAVIALTCIAAVLLSFALPKGRHEARDM